MGRNRTLDASVIIPVYNQCEALRITLNAFKYQSYPAEKYEIIVVNDGSTDELMENVEAGDWPKLECNIGYVHQENKGRAASRNQGIKMSSGKCLVFCDADRLPERDFVKKHIESHIKCEHVAVIGCPWDYFGNRNKLLEYMLKNQWELIKKYSRQPQYYSKIHQLYDDFGITHSKIVWATFLVGNSSIMFEDLYKAGGFDNDFTTWGFEHFELAIRLQKSGVSFRSNFDLNNYHIPHPRETGFYREMIESSMRVLEGKHHDGKYYLLKDFLFGGISLQEFEKCFGGSISETIINTESIVYKINKF